MRNFFNLWILCFVPLFIGAQEVDMVSISGGTYLPLYGTDSARVEVSDFQMDKLPVTNVQFLKFLEMEPQWRRAVIKQIFADDNYLSHWPSEMSYGGSVADHQPVTNVSWYVSKRYCETLEKRLPTIDEWEYVAMADETRYDARPDSLYNQRILSWYEKPNSYLLSVGETKPNVYGVMDLHGLVWEWTYDFNSVLVSGESRKDVDLDRNLFCAGGAVGATDLMNYAAFMRYAFRGSLKANYAVRNLGFRCVKNINDEN